MLDIHGEKLLTPREANQRCLVRQCEGKAAVRGVCIRCYRSAERAVQKKKTTWEELEALGLVLPARCSRMTPMFAALRRESS